MTRLIMFTRSFSCLDQEIARSCLNELRVQPIEINISQNLEAAHLLMEINGSLAVPTFLVADDQTQPITPPLPLLSGQRLRNTDRGSVISEPSCDGLRAFLSKHGFIANDQPANP
jgi:hypothetical protein